MDVYDWSNFHGYDYKECREGVDNFGVIGLCYSIDNMSLGAIASSLASEIIIYMQVMKALSNVSFTCAIVKTIVHGKSILVPLIKIFRSVFSTYFTKTCYCSFS